MLVVLTGLVGCTSDVRFVHKDASNGVVAFASGPSILQSTNRDAAIRLIREKHNPYFMESDIISEGEVVVGQQTSSNQTTDTRPLDRNGKPIGERTTNTTVTATTDKTEYQIKYSVVNRGLPAGDPNVRQAQGVQTQNGNGVVPAGGIQKPLSTSGVNQSAKPVNVDPRTAQPQPVSSYNGTVR